MLATVSILILFVSCTTDNLANQSPRNRSESFIALTAKRKNCGCCEKLTPEERKTRIKQTQVLRKQLQTYRHATELLKEHGLEEGLRRIEAYDPKVWAQLKQILSKLPAVASY